MEIIGDERNMFDAAIKSTGVLNDFDPVSKPSHYASGNIECIDAMRESMSSEAFMGFLKGNVQKYLWRYEKKVNPVEDLNKASWYLDKLIESNSYEEKN